MNDEDCETIPSQTKSAQSMNNIAKVGKTGNKYSHSLFLLSQIIYCECELRIGEPIALCLETVLSIHVQLLLKTLDTNINKISGPFHV